MTPQEFYDLCEQHDWYYAFSDDFRYWQRGERELSTLQSLAKESKELEQILTEWQKHKFSGEPWGTEQQPKPVRPE